MHPRTIISILRTGETEHHTFFLRDTPDLFRKRLLVFTDHRMVISPYAERFPPDHSLPLFWYNLYKRVRKQVQRFDDLNIFRNDCINGKNSFFVGMIQVYSDKKCHVSKCQCGWCIPCSFCIVKFSTSFFFSTRYQPRIYICRDAS